MEPVWSFQHSELCPVSIALAWQFWTHVPNWQLDADIESIAIDGPFAAGTRGRTLSKASGPIEWKLTTVGEHNAVIEVEAAGALVRFHWTLADEHGATRMTQTITMHGEQALRLAGNFGPALAAGIPHGMRKLCSAMQQQLCNLL